MPSTQNLATEDTFKDEIRRLQKEIDGLQWSRKECVRKLTVAEEDRDRLRRQLGDTQQMFHLAVRDRDEARGRINDLEMELETSAARAAARAAAMTAAMTADDISRLEDTLAHDDGLSPHHASDFARLFAALREVTAERDALRAARQAAGQQSAPEELRHGGGGRRR